MKTETFEFAGYSGTNLPAYLWMPDGEVRAVLQVTHGMTEYMGRYEAFAQYLCPMGIAVAGFDLRGHGKNLGDPDVASFGEGGWVASIEDMRLFYELLEQRFPGVPHYMLGFSLGSFLLREYLTKYPDEGEIAGAIIMGTGHQPGWLLSIMMGIVKGQIKKAGFDKTTDLVRQLSFGTYNQKFKPTRTNADWLCADETELDKYLADPLVRKDISAGLFWELLGSMKRTGSAFEYDGWDTSLPILLISGQDDPVGDGGKGVQAIYNRMKKTGMDVKTLSTIIGHISSATTLDIYSHVTDTMQKQAAAKIDRQITKADTPIPSDEKKPQTAKTGFQPYKSKYRKPGTGGIYQLNDHLWEGKYSPRDPHGKRISRNVYAKTREECEEKLAVMIEEVKKQIAAEKEKLMTRK